MVLNVVQFTKVQNVPQARTSVGKCKLRAIFVGHMLDQPKPPVPVNDRAHRATIMHMHECVHCAYNSCDEET